MSDTYAKRLEKLKKLLALANGTANEAEALAALDKAMSYAEQYGLNMDDAKSADAAELKAARLNVKSGVNEWSFLDAELGPSLCKLLRLRAVNAWSQRDEVWEVTYVGEPVAMELFQWLRKTLTAAYRYEKEVYLRYVAGRDGRSIALSVAEKSFRVGFAMKVRQRIDEVLAARVDKSPTGRASKDALVKVTDALVMASINEHGDVLVKYTARSIGRVDEAAVGAGSAAGARVEMGRGMNNTGGPLRLGR